MVTMDFSQRMGLAPTHKVAQADSIDKELTASLWNVLTIHLFSQYNPSYDFDSDNLAWSNFHGFAQALYSQYFKKPVDLMPDRWSVFKQGMREYFFKAPWHRVYSFLEFVVEINYMGSSTLLIDEFNKVLDRENSAYRFAVGKVTPITSPEEIEEIESAISKSDRYAGVRVHLQRSLGLLTDKENPDYRNSIKESISAVESLAKKLVGDDKATLGQALKILETKHNLHNSMKSAFMTLYGYTSDAGGIRHALLDSSTTPTKADARFMLICCSSFINFAIDSIED
ncbi:conserved protein of unknown function [Pseudomonas sp. JV551A1]|uniref:HEPN AbiJ-N-terminal domain-containing protein n=2 Tax=Pseudomonas TaxID=286 RepID=A0AAQ1SVT2_9PSED|nr:conserved protein of unknown function [Pseudomonas sp. JV551A1]SPO62579.1 conserved protein of unknown function [Pseudomonas inefficax]